MAALVMASLRVRVVFRRREHGQHLRVACFLARQRREVSQHSWEHIEERLRRHPHSLLIAAGCGGLFGNLAPVDALHTSIVFGRRIHGDAAQHGLYGPFVFGVRPETHAG